MDYLVGPNKFNWQSGNTRVIQRSRRYYSSSKKVTGLSGASPEVRGFIYDIMLGSKVTLK